MAYGGKLDVRPAYQREYIYAAKDRDEVIRSVKKGFPYQCDVLGQNRRRTLYELMDGQRRTISICRYAAARMRRTAKAMSSAILWITFSFQPASRPEAGYFGLCTGHICL